MTKKEETVCKEKDDGNMTIRQVDPRIKRRFKVLCAMTGISMKDALQSYMERVDEQELAQIKKSKQATA